MNSDNSHGQYDLIVVGGGASGMMAAGRAAERGLRVLLLEKNKRLGEKLRITGGGRCNITHAEEDVRALLKNYGKAEQFLYSIFAQFGVAETFSFFESLGLPLKIEARKRAFPKTEKAEDVVFALEKYMAKNSANPVTVRTNCAVTKILTKDNLIIGLQCDNSQFNKLNKQQSNKKQDEQFSATVTAKEYIFATGSLSHPETGSSGDGFKWLSILKHTVTAPTPTIVPLAVKERWVKTLAGVSLSSMKMTFFVETKKQFSLNGKILFTHFGLSGPLILNSAHAVSDLLQSGIVTARIDLYPQLDLGALEKKVIEIFDQNKNKLLKNTVKEIVPEGMQKGILTLISQHMDVSTKVHSVTKENRKYIVDRLKALPLTVEGLMGFDRAVVADGGVPLDEIDLKTMRSKKIANLLITGDLLHINRPSGGFSLQLCWSTGYVAGSHACENN